MEQPNPEEVPARGAEMGKAARTDGDESKSRSRSVARSGAGSRRADKRSSSRSRSPRGPAGGAGEQEQTDESSRSTSRGASRRAARSASSGGSQSGPRERSGILRSPPSVRSPSKDQAGAARAAGTEDERDGSEQEEDEEDEESREKREALSTKNPAHLRGRGFPVAVTTKGGDALPGQGDSGAPRGACKERLWGAFRPHGEICDLYVPKLPTPANTIIVRYMEAGAAHQAVNHLDGQDPWDDLGGDTLRVTELEEERPRERRSGRPPPTDVERVLEPKLPRETKRLFTVELWPIPARASKRSLVDFAAKYAEVADVYLRPSEGLAEIRYRTHAGAQTAVEQLNGRRHKGEVVNVAHSSDPRPRQWGQARRAQDSDSDSESGKGKGRSKPRGKGKGKTPQEWLARGNLIKGGGRGSGRKRSRKRDPR